jgi:hypothetical protein
MKAMTCHRRFVRGHINLLRFMLCVPLVIIGAGIVDLPGFAQNAPEASANKDNPPPDFLSVKSRLTVRVPGQALHLGEENAFEIALKGPDLQRLVVIQGQKDSFGNPVDLGDQGQEPSLQRRPDGTNFVSVVPVGLGNVEFDFVASFIDGGFETETVTANVVASRPPRRLEIDSMLFGDRSMQYLEVGQQKILWIKAYFEGVPNPLTIPAKGMQFKVSQTKGEPAIRFDSTTGTINSLRLGHALIESTYAGVQQTTCVLVKESDFFDRGNCEELRANGDGVLPTVQGADAPGAQEGSTLPYTSVDRRMGRFVADDRLEIVAPAHPLNVAEDNPIEMNVHGATVARVECEAGNSGCVPRDGYGKVPPPLSFEQSANGKVVVQIFPAQLNTGDSEFKFAVLFADGGVACRTLSASVGFGTKQPRGINMPCGNDSYGNPNAPLRLFAPDHGRPASPTTNLWIDACYDGIPGFVVLPPKVVTYRVLSDEDQLPIQVDSTTGQVTALRPGQALLERKFRGLKSETCFVVAPSAEQDAGDLSNCRVLRAKYAAPLPEPPPPKTPQFIGQNAAAIETALVSPHVKDRFNADERLEIPLKGVELPLGEPARLAIHLTGPDVLRTIVFQQLTQYNGLSKPLSFEDMESFDRVNIDSKTTNIGMVDHSVDGSAFVTLVARRPGTVEFRISMLFRDGGVATRTIRVPVKLPDHAPVRLTNGAGGSGTDAGMSVTTMHLLTNAPDNVRSFFPFAWFQPNGWPIALGPSDVTFAVQQASDPVIRLDPATGTVTALRLGHALVRTRFAGRESETCVVVMANATEGDLSNCDEIREKH